MTAGLLDKVSTCFKAPLILVGFNAPQTPGRAEALSAMRWAAFLTQSLRHLFMLTVCLACSTVFCSYAFYTAKEQTKHAPGLCSINTGEKTQAKPRSQLTP